METNEQTAKELQQIVANLSIFLKANNVEDDIAAETLREFVILAGKADFTSSRYSDYPLHYFNSPEKTSTVITTELSLPEKMLLIANNEFKRSVTAVEKYLGNDKEKKFTLDVLVKDIAQNLSPLKVAEEIVHKFLQAYFAEKYPRTEEGVYQACRPESLKTEAKWLLVFVPAGGHPA
jgi:hypothetical protein